jgi:hypothetical protein
MKCVERKAYFSLANLYLHLPFLRLHDAVTEFFVLIVMFALQVSGKLENTGRVVRVVLDESTSGSIAGSSVSAAGSHVVHVNISGGPLSYQYRVTEIVLHFGSINNLGSEHTINGLSFPAEV